MLYLDKASYEVKFLMGREKYIDSPERVPFLKMDPATYQKAAHILYRYQFLFEIAYKCFLTMNG